MAKTTTKPSVHHGERVSALIQIATELRALEDVTTNERQVAQNCLAMAELLQSERGLEPVAAQPENVTKLPSE